MPNLIRHNETLDLDELEFLEKKESEDRTQLFKVVRVLLLLCFIIPFILAWFRALNGAEDPFSYSAFFVGVGALLLLTGFGVYMTYRNGLELLRSDIYHKIKIVEQTHIVRKQFMPTNHTFFFYLDSTVQLSIEVSEEDFIRLENGDEINIEYTPHSKMYLGYF